MLQRISNFFHSTKAHLMGGALVFLLFTAIGQKNLVPNPSFEIHTPLACNQISVGGGGQRIGWEPLEK